MPESNPSELGIELSGAPDAPIRFLSFVEKLHDYYELPITSDPTKVEVGGQIVARFDRPLDAEGRAELRREMGLSVLASYINASNS